MLEICRRLEVAASACGLIQVNALGREGAERSTWLIEQRLLPIDGLWVDGVIQAT